MTAGPAPNDAPLGRAGAISRFFIERPVLSNVIALVVVLIGLVSLLELPSAQYPNVVPPTVQVTTRFPGASARTLVDSVALPIEQNVNGVENMIYMQSTSADTAPTRWRSPSPSAPIPTWRRSSSRTGWRWRCPRCPRKCRSRA